MKRPKRRRAPSPGVHRALLLQHQGENLFQVSKAHQTLTHLSKTKSSLVSSLVLRAETPRTQSIPVFLLFLKSLSTSILEMSSCIYTHLPFFHLKNVMKIINSFSISQTGGCLAAQEDQQGDMLLKLMCHTRSKAAGEQCISKKKKKVHETSF